MSLRKQSGIPKHSQHSKNGGLHISMESIKSKVKKKALTGRTNRQFFVIRSQSLFFNMNYKGNHLTGFLLICYELHYFTLGSIDDL